MIVLQNILLFLLGAVLTAAVFLLVTTAWKRGIEYATQQLFPPESPPPPTPEQLRAEISKILCDYDILFDPQITTHFATGAYAHIWGKVYEDIVKYASEFAKDLDKSVTTIVVRSIRINRHGKPEFSFEPMLNTTKS
jgi:hypothetical protein